MEDPKTYTKQELKDQLLSVEVNISNRMDAIYLEMVDGGKFGDDDVLEELEQQKIILTKKLVDVTAAE